MTRDSRIAYIINRLGELRELLLVIEQAGDAAPGILLKLAKEKAEEIDRSTRDLRSPHFWEELQNHEPFAQDEPVQETPIEIQPASSEQAEVAYTAPMTDEATEPADKEPQPEAAPADYQTSLDNPGYTLSEEIPLHDDKEPQEETVPETANEDSAEEAEDDTLYPWERLSDEEQSIAQNEDEEEEDEDDDTDMDSDDEEIDDYDGNDLYEEPEDDEEDDDKNTEDTAASPLTLEEALQRQQAKELRKALSLNDRFRFRRELFGNSDIRMNETLALIDAMHSYEEAEDYILNDLSWDEENPEVAEFMKIVQKHFL